MRSSGRSFAWCLLLLAMACAPAGRAPAEEASWPLPQSVLFSQAFGSGVTVTPPDGPVALSGVEIGKLGVPSGRIVACDPFICDGAEAFSRRVPAGKFPVQLAMAKLPHDERVAFARILFADRPAVRWEMALRPGQTLQDLQPGYIHGYGVDTGTGAFMDAATRTSYLAATADEAATMRLVDALNNAPSGSRAWLLRPYGHANVAMFSSGWGDGFYASYFGLDSAGRVVALVTDFGVVEWRAGK
ncbi:MAG: DUF4241 domain-containing protein [Inquilinus sp.]|uniref:DUF4241 domain-containing protein n=1 Tax=Inquilinus sp. TaxID=1932117 RepID=UPI003F33089C